MVCSYDAVGNSRSATRMFDTYPDECIIFNGLVSGTAAHNFRYFLFFLIKIDFFILIIFFYFFLVIYFLFLFINH